MSKYIKRNQEQAIASFTDFLYQLRIMNLIDKLSAQDANLELALDELAELKIDICDLFENPRGGYNGIHGFIAEVAQVRIANAKNYVRGLSQKYILLDDNGPVDILGLDGTEYQMKFVQKNCSIGSGGKSASGIKAHNDKYPKYLLQGGKYMIPKDYYEKIIKLWNMPEEEAKKLTNNNSEGITYRLWKIVHKFFTEDGFSVDDLKPSLLDYDEAQLGNIFETIEAEENKIRKTDKKIRDNTIERSKPSVTEAKKIMATSAVLEGGIEFCSTIAKKRKSGKTIVEFDKTDWKEIGIDTGIATTKGGVRGASVYVLTNFSATPANVATGLVTAVFGVISQANLLRKGVINEEDFIINSETLCLDVTISTVSAMLGQCVIPVPVLGAIIGNTAGMFLFDIAKEYNLKYEQELIENYKKELSILINNLEQEYKVFIEQLNKELEMFNSLLEMAMSINVNKKFDNELKEAFEASIKFARINGVTEEKILKNKMDGDQFFLK